MPFTPFQIAKHIYFSENSILKQKKRIGLFDANEKAKRISG